MPLGFPVRNIKLTIEYDGTRYLGWQVQRPVSRTIQGVLEKTLARILQEKVKVVGSGRTDAGVHALAQVANFKTTSKIRLDKLQRALNGVLPFDIAVCAVQEKDVDFHSRFDAQSKIYRYTILNRAWRPALLRDAVYFYPYALDLKLMKKESRVLLGRHDFKSFQASGSLERHSVRSIKRINISKTGDFVTIDIEADGFLHNMVRNIVGTLIEIGAGRFFEGQLLKILRLRDRRQAGPTVPAKGLCLIKVKY